MAAPRLFRVTFLDDSEPKTVRVGHGTLVAIERKWPEGAPMMESVAYGTFIASGGSPYEPEKFEEYLLSIDDIEALAPEDMTPSEPAATDA